MGSSRKMSRGSLSSAIPMLHRLACPPADQQVMYHAGVMAWSSTEQCILNSSVSAWQARQLQVSIAETPEMRTAAQIRTLRSASCCAGQAAGGRSSAPEMPRCMLPPMRTLRQGSRASWRSRASTRARFSAMPTPISSFISAVYASISCTVRLSTSVSAQALRAPGSGTLCSTAIRGSSDTRQYCKVSQISVRQQTVSHRAAAAAKSFRQACVALGRCTSIQTCRSQKAEAEYVHEPEQSKCNVLPNCST